MTSNIPAQLNTILVEFDGELRPFLITLSRIAYGFDRTFPPEETPWWDGEQPYLEWRSLTERINLTAPEGYVFGAHPNAPTAFGYWPIGQK